MAMGSGGYLGELEQMILLAVHRLGDDAYGLGVMDELERRVGRQVSRGAVYVTLDRLEEKGLVTARQATASAGGRGGRPRRLLSVTPRGVDALHEARRAWLSLWEDIAWEESS
jgi:DNA-binding PadR family transcriptional regulator